MNILPHKSWHVRTKTNIARVRKDEAKAAEEEAARQRKVAVADYEARIDFLRKRSHHKDESDIPCTSTTPADTIAANESPDKQFTSGQHIDLFADYEDKVKKIKPMDEEKRLEQEKYEKQIGYLTYLGQDTNEALGTRNWYDQKPKRQEQLDDHGRRIEVGFKAKQRNDPMFRFLKKANTNTLPDDSENNKKTSSLLSAKISTEIIFPSSIRPKRKRLHSSSDSGERKKRSRDKKKKKHHKEKKKRKHRRSSSGVDSDCKEEEQRTKKLETLKKLREKRLQREQAEKSKVQEFLMTKYPALLPPPKDTKKPEETIVPKKLAPTVKQKYNSQFNPELAKQNYM